MAFKRNDSCFQKAADDEPIFTLRAKDVLAPQIVEAWADLAQRHGTPEAKLAEARACAVTMRVWQISNSAKVPD
jgi:hypothetical protein